jgi:O-antigen/teichoic acid export membrane protein
MCAETSTSVAADSVSLNLITESVSRFTLIVAGLVSGALLVRTVNLTSYWNLSDYAHLQVLMYWNQMISLVVVFGLSTAIIRSVSSFTDQPKKIGSILVLSLVTVTIIFLIFAIFTTGFAEQVGFLKGDSLEVTNELRTMWILVLISILPSAYTTIARSFFSGIQRMKRSLVVDITYNGSRIVILLFLFISMEITLTTILYMYLLTTILGFMASLYLIIREIRSEGINLNFSGIHDVSQPLFKVSLAFFALSLISSFGNYIVPLLVDFFGTDIDMARYSIADSSNVTLRTFLYAPFAVLLPNITSLFSRGANDELRKRFNQSNRIIIPTLIFAFVSILTFGGYLLGGIYGVRALDTTNGLSSLQFLIAMSPGLVVVPMIGIYYNILIAINKMKILVILGSVNVIAQVLWIYFVQPLYGVIALALLWVVAAPLFLVYHYYTRRITTLTIGRRLIIRGAALALITLPIAYGVSLVGGYIVDQTLATLGFIPFINTTTTASIMKLMFLIPLWYLFLSLSLAVGVMRLVDIENLTKFLMKIPPVWWISRPLIKLVIKMEKQRTKIM